MIKIEDMDLIKKTELNILVHFDAFCKANGLRYFLAYGTLIGAIRHKGFIPWDDDVDVQMPRSDYNWLIKNYNLLNPNGKFRVVAPIEDNSPFSFVKFVDNETVKIETGVDYSKGMMGIDIDIFPLDGEPEDEKEYKKWYKKLKNLYALHMYCSKDTQTTFKRKLIVPIIRLITGGRKWLLKKALRLHAKYPYEKSNFVGVVESFFNSPKNRYNKQWFESSIETEFEGHMFSIPCGYDEVLRTCYGDYMKIPPVEYQVPYHNCQSYIKEKFAQNEKI